MKKAFGKAVGNVVNRYEELKEERPAKKNTVAKKLLTMDVDELGGTAKKAGMLAASGAALFGIGYFLGGRDGYGRGYALGELSGSYNVLNRLIGVREISSSRRDL